MKRQAFWRFFVLFVFLQAWCHGIDVKSYTDIKFRAVDRQLHEYTCGIAVLSTLFTCFFDIPMTEEQVIRNGFMENIIEDRRGISFLDMKSFIIKQDFECDGYKVNYSGLMVMLDKTDVPVIVHLNVIAPVSDMKGGHFAILVAKIMDYLVLKDPARGNILLCEDDFIDMFSGYILLAHPKEKDNARMERCMVKTAEEKAYAIERVRRMYIHEKLFF